MLSDDEKPNLRPKKYFDAHGKSLGICYCLITSWGGSSVRAILKGNKRYTMYNPFLSEPGLFGIEAPNVDYSLHKQKRWELFNEIVQQNIDDRLSIQPEFQRQKSHSTSAVISQNEYHIEIKSYLGELFRRRAMPLLSMKLLTETRYSDEHIENCYTCISQTEIADDNDIMYSFDIATRRKVVPSIRTNHRNNMYGNFRAHKRYHLTKEDIYDDIEQSSSDCDEILDSVSTCPKFNPIKLNDFPLLESKKFRSQSQRIQRHSNRPSPKKANNYKGKIIYHQYGTTTRKHVQQSKPTPRRPRYMPLSFRSVALHRNELNHEYLLKTYGKDLILAECSPTKYLICLTNRLESLISSNESYLVIIVNKSEDICYAKVGLNMDLNIKMLELENVLTPDEKVYRIEELIEKVIEFLQTLPARMFKPMKSKINQRLFAKTAIDCQLSDIEFLNKKIQQVHELNHNNVQNDFVHSASKICSICYEDMEDVASMTALKACGHWLCNTCWTQYLQNSIDYVKLIVCPELHCTSVVDAGTILSLVNQHYLNKYERHIEQCLLNSSRSYVRCPRTNCSNIVTIIDSSCLDCVQCRCGYEFCLECREEAHFPATCRSTQFYMHVAAQRGHLNNGNKQIITTITGRKCISCNQFIEKNGGCNHMRCRCGVQFCWLCTGRWSEHSLSVGIWRCPKPAVSLQERIIVGETSALNNLYTSAIYHRHQRAFHVQIKMKENAKRLISTLSLSLDIEQFDERYALFEHCCQLVEYLVYLHRICEFASVSAQGYCYEPKQFFNSLQQFEMIIYHMEQLFEVGRGYSSIEQFNELYQRSEALIQRLQRAVRLQRNSRRYQSGYITA